VTLPIGNRWWRLALLEGLVVVLVLAGAMVDDLEDLDEAERGPQPPQDRLLAGVDLGHGPGRLPPLVASGSEVEVDAAALGLEFVDLALAVVFAGGLEGQDLEVAGQALQLGQQFSYRHLPSVAVPALYVRWRGG
jgi:hypothetical protein